MSRSYWKRIFSNPLWGYFTRRVVAQRNEDPTRLPLIRWAGISINRIWESACHPYDIRFSKNFSDFSWFERFDQSETLRNIMCPTTFIKATTRYDKRGNLLAALSEEDCQRVGSLVPDSEIVHVRSSHDVHFAHPRKFARSVIELTERI